MVFVPKDVVGASWTPFVGPEVLRRTKFSARARRCELLDEVGNRWMGANIFVWDVFYILVSVRWLDSLNNGFRRPRMMIFLAHNVCPKAEEVQRRRDLVRIDDLLNSHESS